jgi:hypothetical protein
MFAVHRVVLAATLASGLALAAGGTASGAAPAASCVGHEASSISPPGSSDEFPAGMPGLLASIRDAFPDTPPGAIVSTVAKLHEGSHEACDEALE